jgi:hypothetical protein
MYKFVTGCISADFVTDFYAPESAREQKKKKRRVEEKYQVDCICRDSLVWFRCVIWRFCQYIAGEEVHMVGVVHCCTTLAGTSMLCYVM